MFKITVIKNTNTYILDANKDDNLLDVLRKNNIFIPANCGGMGSCKKCKVDYQNKEILSCQTRIVSDMTITLPSLEYSAIDQSLIRKFDFIKQEGYGIAFDIGTTTIAAYLFSLDDGREIDSISRLNPQASYGADVISRIKMCSDGYLHNLHKAIIDEINEIILTFINKNKLDEIAKITIAANTTMLHIICNIDPTPLGVAPFSCVFLDNKELSGEELGIKTNKVIILPSISAYIGSDIVSGMLACSFLEEKENVVLIDIGTNGEIVLKTNNGYYGTSTAAGPAFEGAKIECGMGGVNGAIAKAKKEGDKLFIQTIANAKPIGICGSGLVDIISILVKEGIIDETGYLNSEANSSLIKYLDKDRFYITKDIFISQKDIREFQLAKSAIISGLHTLLDVANITYDQLPKLYLAGGFGFYLNIENAVAVGLLPKQLTNKIISVGNSSGLGAKMVLINPKYLEDCKKIRKKVKTVELSNNSKFSNYFIENMLF